MLTSAFKAVAFTCTLMSPVAAATLKSNERKHESLENPAASMKHQVKKSLKHSDSLRRSLSNHTITEQIMDVLDSLLGTEDVPDILSKISEPECTVPKPIDTEAVRSILAAFVKSLPDDESHHNGSQISRGYHPDADQEAEWHLCTIVSQCLEPDFILSLHDMSGMSRSLVYKALSRVMSQESFNMLQLQQHSNMLLGEMQDWATTCDGECHELDDPQGLLNPVIGGIKNPSTKLDVDYDTCATFRTIDKRFTYWRCNDEPRFFAHGQIDTATGNYFLGDIFNEPHIHGRNSAYDFFAAYGDMNENGGGFGLRFSGHHTDLNFEWNDAGELIRDTPVFLGHNPLTVPQTTPPLERDPDDRANIHDQGDHYLMWQNMAGVVQFQEGVDTVIDVANVLLDKAPGSYLLLENWLSTGHFGTLSLKEGDVTDYDYADLSTMDMETFETIWAMIKYTLKFSRGHQPTGDVHDLFRSQGKALWTSFHPEDEGLPLTDEDLRSNLNFIFLHIETDEWRYFVLANQLFVVVSETEPSNHLHSMLIEKKFLTCDQACCNGTADAVCALPPNDDENHHH